MAYTERLEATELRGEACIFIRTWAAPAAPPFADAADGRGQASYRLATGEQLAATENPVAFETLDRSRRFTLRQR